METQTIEYKLSWRDDFLKEISGFANAQGGTLYIGINDKGEVVGIEQARQLMEKLPNQCIMTMGIALDVNLLEEQGKKYLSLRVKPSEQAIAYKGKYYSRSGTTLQELTGAALSDFLLSKMNLTWDSMPVLEATMDNIDDEAIRYFVQHGIDCGRLTAKADNGTTLDEKSMSFHTDWPEGIETVPSDQVQSTKVVRDGQILILCDGKTYTLTGQEVK